MRRVHPDPNPNPSRPPPDPPMVAAYAVSEDPPPYDDAEDGDVLSQISAQARQQRQGEERILRIESDIKLLLFEIKRIKKDISKMKGAPMRASAKQTRKRKKKRR